MPPVPEQDALVPRAPVAPPAPVIEISSSEEQQEAQLPTESVQPIAQEPAVLPTSNAEPQNFVWHPVKRKDKRKAKALDASQGYRTLHLHNNLFLGLKLENLSKSYYLAAHINVIMYRKNREGLEVLQEQVQGATKPVMTFFLTHNIFQEKWSTSEAQEHLVNETMFQLRRRIILKEKHQNPIKRWSDAC